MTCSGVVRGMGTGEGGRRARGVEEAEAKGGRSARGCGCGGAGGRVWQPGGGVRRRESRPGLSRITLAAAATIYLGHEHCKGG